jgi:transcriptional regulator with XRE-family HTH domain
MPVTDGRTLREWRRARGWDVPQLARQLRHASKEPVAAHDGLVRMIRSWERGTHSLSERYELLYRSLGFERATLAETAEGAGFEGAAFERTAPTAGLETVGVCCKTADGRITFLDVPLQRLTGTSRLTGADSLAMVPAAGPPRRPL